MNETVRACVAAARVKAEMRELMLAAVGHTPQGFGFGRVLDAELMNTFGVELEAIEARELIDAAKSFRDEDCAAFLRETDYCDYVDSHGVGALASRCWPDFFTAYGTPVCTVLSMLNDRGVAAACEADVYGALSMWIGMRLSGEPVFFGDPVSLDESESSLTFWHCGAAACSLARKDTGAEIGVHPNRKIGPAMNFGCEAFSGATIFRIGREPDGSFRFFIAEGEGLDKPRQFIGTSLVIATDTESRKLVEESVLQGFEPHFAVMKGRHGRTLEALAKMLGAKVCRF